VLQEFKPSYSSGQEWKLPVNLAVAFHVLLALAVFYLPGMFNSKPRFEDIYTVNLVNLADIPDVQPVQEIVPPPEPVQPPKAEESIPENAVSIAEKPVEPVVAPPEPPKAISIKPSKRKVKKKIAEQKLSPRESELDRKRRQRLAEMIRAEQVAAEQARILAEEAALEKKLAEEAQRRLEEAEAQQARMNAQQQQQSSRSSSAMRDSSRLSALEKQYFVAITSRLHSYWSVPEYMSDDLSATVVITIASDGTIMHSFFEITSGDRIFDNFVTKTLQDVGKLPPIPPALNRQRMEVGLRFSPAGIR